MEKLLKNITKIEEQPYVEQVALNFKPIQFDCYKDEFSNILYRRS